MTDLIRLYQRRLKVEVIQEFGGLQQIDLYHCPDSDLSFFDPPVAGSSHLYQQLQQFDWYYLEEKPEYAYTRQLIQPSDRILEVGSGRGAFAKQISSQHYTGLELSETAQQMAQAENIRVVNESLSDHTHHHPAVYDVVCAFQVLEHVPVVRAFIQDCLTCLKPGGLLIFSVPSVDSFGRYVSNSILDFPPHHLTRWSDRALRQISHYFPVEMVRLWHEPLQPAHRQFYLATLVQTALRNHLGWNFQSIDLTWSQRMMGVVSRTIAKFLAPGLTSEPMLPQGISVTAVYRKLPMPAL